MPLPVIHSFAGYTLYRITRHQDEKSSWPWALSCMFLANLADFDFLPGIAHGDPTSFHRQLTHTLGAALLCGGLFALVAKLLKKDAVKIFLVGSAAYYSHVILDFMGGTTSPMLLFWPFSGAYFHSSLGLFLPLDLPFGTGLEGFLAGVFSEPGIMRLAYETAFVAILSYAFEAVRRVEKRWSKGPAFAGLALAFLFALGFAAFKVFEG